MKKHLLKSELMNIRQNQGLELHKISAEINDCEGMDVDELEKYVADAREANETGTPAPIKIGENLICENCGFRYGLHSGIDNYCPTSGGGYDNKQFFKELKTDFPQHQPLIKPPGPKKAPTTKRRRELIPAAICNKIRANNNGWNEVFGTGRAVCRQCGEKIGADMKGIQFQHKFAASPYSPVKVQIHMVDCGPVCGPVKPEKKAMEAPIPETPANDGMGPELAPVMVVLGRLTPIPGGFQLLAVNLLEFLIFDADGDIYGMFHKNLCKGFMREPNADLIEYINCDSGVGPGAKFRPFVPNITISNWNNTLWADSPDFED